MNIIHIYNKDCLKCIADGYSDENIREFHKDEYSEE